MLDPSGMRDVSCLALAALLGSCSDCPAGGRPSSWIPFSEVASESSPRLYPLATIDLSSDRGILGDLDGDGPVEGWLRVGNVLHVTDASYTDLGAPLAGLVELTCTTDDEGNEVVSEEWSRALAGSVLTGVTALTDPLPELSLVSPTGDVTPTGRGLAGDALQRIWSSALSVDRGDTDGDGVDELLIGSPRPFGDRGSLTAYSWSTGERLWQLRAPRGSAHFAASVAILSGNAREPRDNDLIVGDSGGTFGDGLENEGPGKVHVFSGQSRELRYSLCGQAVHDQFGAYVAPLGDLDGDAFADFAVCASGSSWSSPPRGFEPAGYLQLVSGRHGEELWTVFGDERGQGIAKCALDVGDLDEDGIADVLVGVSGTAVAWILSGRNAEAVGVLGWPRGGWGWALEAYFVDGLLDGNRPALVIRVYSEPDQLLFLFLYDLGRLGRG